ncbi:MAG: hypothetical protein HYW50_03685 [Candidatus Diapherotrites archaeon]|nr:hypothetical protein [Candidatus Diapherotrites archaeon]
MKKTVLLALLFFSANAFSIGFETDKSVYEKLETVMVSGNCFGTGAETISAVSDSFEIFSKPVECKQDKTFDFEYKTSFLDHSGEWVLTFFSQKEQATKTIFVKEKREAGFFLVRFLSPTEGRYQRNQKIILSVEVIDAGTRIADSQVVGWGAKGEKLVFQNNSTGQYVLEYIIPLDSPAKDWRLEVLAQAKKGENFFGGIGQLGLSVEPAPIILEVLEPKVSSFEQGEKIDFDVIVKYASGEPIKEGQVFLQIGENTQNLEQITLENFKGEYSIPSGASGALEIELKAVDFAQNSGIQKIKVVVGCSVTCIVRQYGLIAVAAVLIGFALTRIVLMHYGFKGRRKRLEKEKEKFENIIRDLQKEYFTKGVMPASSYKKNLSEYKSRLLQVEQELSDLKRKEQVE